MFDKLNRDMLWSKLASRFHLVTTPDGAKKAAGVIDKATSNSNSNCNSIIETITTAEDVTSLEYQANKQQMKTPKNTQEIIHDTDGTTREGILTSPYGSYGKTTKHIYIKKSGNE